MATVSVRIPTPLRSFTGGANEVMVDGATAGEAIQALIRIHDGLSERILTPDGALRAFVNVYIGGHDIRNLDGLRTVVSNGDILSIVPAVAGGQP